MANYHANGTPIRIQATGAVQLVGCRLLGVLVSASSSGTLTLYDNTAASGTVICSALPVTAGQYVSIPAACNNGLYLTLGGTADLTFFVH